MTLCRFICILIFLIAGSDIGGQAVVFGSLGSTGFSFDKGIVENTEGFDRFENVSSNGILGYDASLSILWGFGRHWKIGAGIQSNSRRSNLRFDYMMPVGSNVFEFKRYDSDFYTKRFGISANCRYQLSRVFFHGALTFCKVTNQNLNPEPITYGTTFSNEDEFAQTKIKEEYHRRQTSFNEVFSTIGIDLLVESNLYVGVSLGMAGLRMKHGHRLYSFHHALTYDLDATDGVEKEGSGQINYYEAKFTFGVSLTYAFSLKRNE